MDKFFEEIARIIEKYGDAVVTLGIVTFIIALTLTLTVGIFVCVLKSLWDEDKKMRR